MLLVLVAAALVVPAVAGATAPSGRAAALAPFTPKTPVLSTPWTSSVSTTQPLPEYPRPQMQRSRWENLNGRWGYAPGASGETPPFGRSLPETILVPFPVQSALSGIERSDRIGWYRRTFTVPRNWRGQRVLLNFGAVSWGATVWVNRRLVGRHRGDYSGFSLDITSALKRSAPNELIVEYANPMGQAGEPVGKQAPGAPSGIQHTAVSGIWQTVWLEPVPSAHLAGLQLVPDLAHHRLQVRATLVHGGGDRLRVQALAGRRVVASAEGPDRSTINVVIHHPRLWWPWSPYLYNLRVQLVHGRRVLDSIASYFGMRSVTLGRVAGATRVLLNGRFLFQTGALDQGYWPDGLYTPPTDSAMRFDVRSVKRLGYDMVREHQKVQPDRWYMWADRNGLLVWQDMPSMPIATPHPPTSMARTEFMQELTEIVTERRSHPSIVTWIPFNEGWQQFDLTGVARRVKQLDPAALVDAQSGSGNCCDALETRASDIRDTHLYTGPFAVPPDRRASVVGEYGGVLPFAPVGDRWPGTQWSVGNPAAQWSLGSILGVMRRQYGMLAVQMATDGLSGAIFTEFSATEQELGVLSYDRRVFTISPGFLGTLNRDLIAASEHLSTKNLHRGVVPAGTSGYWPLDEGTGTVAADTSGGRHSLTLGAAGRWTLGRHRRPALLLNGDGTAAQTAAPVINTASSFTVAAWLRADAGGESATAVGQPGPKGSSFSLGIDTQRGTQTMEQEGEWSSGVRPPALRTWWTFATPNALGCSVLTCGVQANMHYDDGRLSVRPGTWHYVTGVYDGSTATLTVYVDGEPQDTEHVDAVPPSVGPLTLGSGSYVYAAQDSFWGAISQLRTYGRGLSSAEVWQLYEAQQ